MWSSQPPKFPHYPLHSGRLGSGVLQDGPPASSVHLGDPTRSRVWMHVTALHNAVSRTRVTAPCSAIARM